MNGAATARIGKTGVSVTRLGLGCAPLGGLYAAVSDEQALATVEQAWELGVRTFDTAPLYGSGLSEERVGAALSSRVPRRVHAVDEGRQAARGRRLGGSDLRGCFGGCAGLRLLVRRCVALARVEPRASRARPGRHRAHPRSRRSLRRGARRRVCRARTVAQRRGRRRDRRRHEPGRGARSLRARCGRRLLPHRGSLHTARPRRPRRVAAALRRAWDRGDCGRRVQQRHPHGRRRPLRLSARAAGARRARAPACGCLRAMGRSASGGRAAVPARPSGGGVRPGSDAARRRRWPRTCGSSSWSFRPGCGTTCVPRACFRATRRSPRDRRRAPAFLGPGSRRVSLSHGRRRSRPAPLQSG